MIPTEPNLQASGTMIRYQGVYKAYAANPVLRQLDLSIEAGAFVAIVGRSGCGKSTLLRLTAGLEVPSGGAIVATLPAGSGRGDTRVMFQDARLLPWKTVLANVGLGLSGDWHSRAHLALRQVGLAEKAAAWPSTLSGGQRQRVALARALVHRPNLLLLDEPLGALDALTRIDMQQLIENIWQEHGFTALLVTHDVAEAVALADRILLIEDGVIGLDIPVDLPRPRARGSAAFAALEAKVLARVLQQEQRETVASVPLTDPIRVAIGRLQWAL